MKSKLTWVLIVVFCIGLVGCNQPGTITEEDKNNAVWLNLEGAEDFWIEAEEVQNGKVVLSGALDEVMKEYPDDTVFAVAICFSSMVSQEEVNALSYNELHEYLNEVYQKAKRPVERAGIMVDYPRGTCETYQFFYAFGTEEQFRRLTCKLGVSLYIAATYQYK